MNASALRRPVHAALLAALLAALACGEAPRADPGELLTIRTVGLAYLEENRLEEALAEFQRLVALAPGEPLGYANLGLTYLRMGRLEEAEAQVRDALELEPQAPDVRLILSEILLAQQRPADARVELERALAADSTHVKALYALASLDADSTSGTAPARRATTLGRLVALAPGNVATRVEHAQALLRAGDAEGAAAALEELRQLVPEFPVEGADLFDAALAGALRGDAAGALGPAMGFHNVMRTTPAYQQGLIDLRGPGGVLVGFPVVTFSETLGAAARDAEEVVAALRFTDVTDVVGIPPGAPDLAAAALQVVDFDGDGDRDAWVGGRLLQNEITGFVDVTQAAGLAGPTPSAALFGDYDNDGALDLYLARPAGGALYRNRGDATFEDVTASLGVPLPAGAPLFLEFDQDGDLDLFVGAPEGGVMLRNNLDGTFTDLSERAGVGAPVGAGGEAAFGDFDDDDDLDFVLVDPGGALRLYDNERLGRMVERASERGLAGVAARLVDVGDYNNDGLLDLLVAGPDGIGLHANQGGGSFAEDARPAALLSAGRTFEVHDVAFIDFDNDGWLDVLLAGREADGSGRAALYRNAAAGRFDDVTDRLPTVPALRSVAAADFGDDGDLDLFVSSEDGSLRLLRNDGGNANRYLKMQLVGLSTGSGKNNHFGIGAKLEVRAGGLYQVRVVTGPEIHVGLGQRARADVVRVRWPNGVPQNLFYPGANQSVVEEQILKGSCPFLYTWNGERFEFVTDLMWKSALGMPMGLMAQGGAEYAPANASSEYLRIPQDALRERDGAYELRVTGELWEVFYIDEVDLVAVDHPDSIDVFVDERFGFVDGEFALEVQQVTERRYPRAATDHRGRDVLPRLLAADDIYVHDFRPERYQGVSELHDLVLDLGDFDADERVRLHLRGWIFPTDASVNVALWQSAAVEAVMPYLEVPDSDGSWVTAIPALGFPAGKSKTMITDLTGLFPTDDHRVRIRTNMNIYWDEAFATLGEVDAPTRVSHVEVSDAELRFRGFSKPYRKGGRFGPHWFDYQAETSESPWRPIHGLYTRYGDVTGLLRDSDDRYPIMGPGDEIALRFAAADLPPLPDGWSRTFLIHTEGWVKDADLNTAEGWKVGPLPFASMSGYPYGPDESYPHQRLADSLHTRPAAPAAPLGGPLTEIR